MSIAAYVRAWRRGEFSVTSAGTEADQRYEDENIF